MYSFFRSSEVHSQNVNNIFWSFHSNWIQWNSPGIPVTSGGWKVKKPTFQEPTLFLSFKNRIYLSEDKNRVVSKTFGLSDFQPPSVASSLTGCKTWQTLQCPVVKHKTLMCRIKQFQIYVVYVPCDMYRVSEIAPYFATLVAEQQ